MSGSYSYPGIYIQELPSSSHAIVPAPTSIAAFIGYSHPYKTAAFGVAQQLFSFSDYETYFGGLFSSGLTDASLPRAVYQFFLNGGSTAWVVGLQPGLFSDTQTTDKLANRLGPGGLSPPSSAINTTGGGFHFIALEPIDVMPMAVTITNVRNSNATFDVIVTYGNQVETYRGVTIPVVANAPKPTDPAVMINGVSALINIAPTTSTGYGSALTTVPVGQITWTDVTSGLTFDTGYDEGDFLPVFAANSSLDNVEIFNLLIVPGNTDNAVISAALAFAERKRAFAIVDPPPQAPAVVGTTTPPAPIDAWMNAGVGGTTLPMSQNGALYFPYLRSTDPVSGQIIPMAPSGFVAGVYAATDASRGVWKAPAGLAPCRPSAWAQATLRRSPRWSPPGSAPTDSRCGCCASRAGTRSRACWPACPCWGGFFTPGFDKTAVPVSFSLHTYDTRTHPDRDRRAQLALRHQEVRRHPDDPRRDVGRP